MQKRACQEFIANMKGWVLVKEYFEKGVSGFKKSSEERDVLTEVRADAIRKDFDILLVFMFDRIGRRDDETPFVVEWFVKNGIEVWSVKEGQQRFETHVDKLLNYIRYWQASGESLKTSVRVDTKHRQMIESGEFRGGVPPYGYKLVKSGKVNKKGRELKMLAIDEEEANVVKLVYDLALNKGMGGLRISQYLNEHNVPTRKGSQWGLAVVNYMLRNPIYKGYLTYGKTTSKGKKQGRVSPKDWILSNEKIDELAIIPEHVWDKIQVIRNSRTPDAFKLSNLDYSNYPLQTKSSLLFVGFIRCGCCGSKMSTGYSKKSWTTKDGVVHSKAKSVYKCIGKTSGKVGCTGNYTYSPEKIEGIVLEEVFKYLDTLKTINLSEQIEKLLKQNISNDEQNFKKLQKSIKTCEDELEVLKGEIAKSIMGQSTFTPELLNSVIEQKNKELENFKVELEKTLSTIESKKIELNDMINLQKTIPIWREEFERSSKEVKKMLLAQIIDEIIVYPDKIEINLKMYIQDFIKSIENSNIGIAKSVNNQLMESSGNLQEQNLCNRGFFGLEARYQ